MNVVYVRIAAKERGPFRIDDPRDLRQGMGVANRRHRRQGVDDIAERARFNDQDRFNFRFQKQPNNEAGKDDGSTHNVASEDDEQTDKKPLH